MNTAARAAGGQMLGTEPVDEAATTTGLVARPLGSVPLRGLLEPVPLSELVPCPALPDRP